MSVLKEPREETGSGGEKSGGAGREFPEEIPIDEYSKYQIIRQRKDSEEEYEEEFDWYDPSADTTYFCLALGNTWYRCM